MAASICKKRHKNVGLCVSFAFISLCIVPLCDTFSVQTEELRLNIPHNAETGFIVMKADLKETCLIVDHIQKHRSSVINPFTVSASGYLVTKSSLVDNIGDLFIIHLKSTEACRNKTVSKSFPVHVEITHDRDRLGFFYDRYEGSLADDAPANTKVQSIEHLYACSVTTCRNNLDYRILGSDGFYMKTASIDGHIELEIYTRRPAAVMKNIESLLIVAQNADGQQGHTNIEVKLVSDADDTLYFVPIRSQRHKRETPADVLPVQQVNETATGVLFTLPSPPAGQSYTLVSSTYKDAFTVSSEGIVSVSQGFKLDYETLTADGGSNTVQLRINRSDADNVVKEFLQAIEVNDVNDEPPRFTNTPTPFLAAVNPNAQANILVYSLTAVDPDAGGDLRLEVDTTQNDARVSQFFSINILDKKADILRRGSDPFNENEIFNVYFIATDLAAPVGTQQRTTTHVEIRAGRREPQFMKTSYVLQFQENNAINLDISPTPPIEVFTFQDRPIIFEVRNMNDQPSTVFTAISEISNSQIKACKIRIGRVVDYEKGPREYNVTLRAIEEETGLYSEILVQIFVIDKNEFQPTFTKSAYTKDNVPENTPVGTILLTVTSTDEDYNTKIKFSVDNDLFRVEAVPSGSDNVHLANIIVDGDLDYDFISPKNYEFSVFATDNGAISKTGRATIQIFMLDVNDEDPQFPVDPMTTRLRYDAPVGQEVFYVFASDADSGDKVTYKFIESYDKFSLNADTGRINLTQIIAPSQDRISVFTYELVVIAVDDGGCCGKTNRLTSTGTVTVNILTDNVHRPVFENCNTYDPSVDEEVAGAFVIRVQATDADYGDFGVVTYSIKDVDSKFRINSTTGDLYTKVAIDRETDLVGTTRLVVNVVGTDGGNSENVCSLLVLINDVNDNDPIFTLSSYDVTITNLLTVDKVAAYIEAKDKDIQNNQQVLYSFAQSGNPGDYFKFDDPSYVGQIKVAKDLPQQQNIELTVIATDMGIPPRHSNATVNIKITMPSENQPPQWMNSNPTGFTVTVPENETIRTNVMNFTAISNVLGNTDLTFKTIYAENEEEIFSAQVFGADPASSNAQIGVLFPKVTLDYERETSYSVTVRASDINNMYSDRVITVMIEDVNDMIPEFVLKNKETDWLDVTLDEGNYIGTSNPGKEIVVISAIDNDKTSPNNRIVEYTISANDFFTINSATGMLYTQKEFDREAQTYVYTFTVKAKDGAPSALKTDGTPNIGQVNVRVTINDINDNPPKFEFDKYEFDASEDIQINQIIPAAKVQATDPDSTAKLTYNIRNTATAVPFTVQRQTGDIMVAASLDYDKGEEYRKYVFEVVVDDTLNSATTTVTIRVTDVNDNPPVVTGIYMFDQFEEENPNDIGVIAKITATDIDNDNVNTFYYQLSFPSQEDSQYFGIDYTSGELSIIKQLDRDYPNGKAEFQFMVVVADSPDTNPNALFGYGDITVKPKDINDNKPFLVVDELGMRVMENQPIGTLVGRVKAEDYDYKENGTVNIAVLEMRPDNVFRLNEETLDLYTLAELDRETIDTYYVVVQLTDNGSKNQLSSTGTLTINVGDENDNKPKFNQSYHFKLSEHQTSGEIGRIEAFDADIGVNANITYTIATKDAVHFQMDQDRQLNMGVLKIYVPVDYDDPTQRTFNVTAYAVDPYPGPNNTRRAETYIIVDVSDYNDEVPEFVESEKSVSVPENTPVGYILATFNASDKDVDPDYGSFKYYIQRLSDPDRRFEINQIDTTGDVSIQNLLDRETAAEHRVKILAIDNVNGSPQNTGTATLIVTVTDVNDNFPDFAANYQPNLSENTDFKNYSVISLSAIDADDENMDHGKPFSFELICTQDGGSSQCSKFRLDFNPSGDNNRGAATIYVTGKFDREEEKVVVLPIKMCDLYNKNRPQEQQCGFRYLNVGIQNENDNGINEGYQSITVFNYKGLFGGIEIGLVNTNDLDDPDESDSPSTKQYTLENSDIAGKFVLLDSDTGKITLQPNVPEMSFEIRVSVKDLVHNLEKMSTVRITIIFVDDDAVFNAGSIRIEGVTAEEFITKPKSSGGSAVLGQSMMEKIRAKFAEKLYGSNSQANVENVQILSIMGYDTYTDVLVAAHGSPYYQRSRMEGIVASDRQGFNELLKTDGVGSGTIDMVPIDMCQFESCEGGCFNKLNVEETPKLVSTYGASYVGVDTRVDGTCGCRAQSFPTEIECTPGYCYHGGECEKDPWNVVSCKCPDGFEGPRCQKLRQSFNGTGYALYRPFEQCEQSRTSIEVLPSKPNGLILYNGPVAELTPSDNRDFIMLELVGGHPRFRIDHGTGELELSITGPNRLNDGVWHRIDIYREKKNIRMVIDHCVNSNRDDRSDCEATGVTKGENIYINAADPLQLGGRMSAPSYPASVTTEKFDGCMKNLIHNAEIYDLSTGGQFPGAMDGCQKEDDACSKSCNHGQCMITGGIPGNVVGECICEPGYRSSGSQNCDTETSVKDFGYQSYMNWNIKNTYVPLLDNKKMEITFHFRSRDNNGLIFSVTDETDGNKYIKFMIVNSRLMVVYNLGDDRYDLQLSHVPQVNDGQWHKVTLERYGKQFILKMDSGEGRYYADTLGPINGAELFKVRQDQVYAGASLSYSGTDVTIIGDDFNSSCMNDIRYDDAWFPMTVDEGSASLIATVNKNQNTKDECVRNDCTEFKCPDPLQCRPLWEAFDCVCPEHYTLQNGACINYCEAVQPCFQGTCTFNPSPAPGEDPFMCVCPAPWFGPLCQCHPSLNPGGEACFTAREEEQSTAMAGGIIAAIILGVLFLIVVVFIIAYLLMRRNRSDTKEPFDDDMDDDIRENVMYYDEEGAGEEDMTQYDLSRLRKPDDGEHPSTWDAPDIPISTKPLGAAADRPDVGDFISNRLNDADDDPSSPPYDTPHDFNFEGGSSDAGSLSSLNTSSTGSQDYDYLNEWGPKFAKLADMYNNYEDAE